MLPDPYFPFFNPYVLACRDGSLLAGLRPTLKRVAQIAPLLSFAEARLHLKLDPLPVDASGQLLADGDVAAHPDDPLVKGMALAAQAELDGWNSWTGRGVVQQQWKLSLRGFPSGPLALPLPPLKSVDAVTYRKADGTREVVSAALYTVRQSEAEPHAIVSLNTGAAWPDLPPSDPVDRLYDDAVEVTFTTGYDDGHPDLELFKAYARLRLGMLYENREAIVVGTIATVLPAWENMLDNLRVRHPDFLLAGVQ